MGNQLFNMKFLVLFTVVACASAVNLVAYPNGAVAPAKTPEVVAAEAAHFAAKGVYAPYHGYNGYYGHAGYAGYPYAHGAWGAFGCDGAWPPAHFDWLVNNNNGRTEKESCYPYTASDGRCKGSSSCNYMGAHVTGMYNKWDTTESAMKDLVYINPVTTTILASYLGDYSHGVYDDSRCCEQMYDSNCKYNLNHEITVVGYGKEGGKDYWLIKNSWGSWFGENGYLKMKRGTGHCGVGTLHFTSAYCAPN